MNLNIKLQSYFFTQGINAKCLEMMYLCLDWTRHVDRQFTEFLSDSHEPRDSTF